MIDAHDLELGSARFRLLASLVHIRSGTATAIVGKNGSGKTTLLEAFLGLRKPLGGKVFVDGRVADGWLSVPSNRRRMGVQLQSMSYPAKTCVREVVKLHSIVYDCLPTTDIAHIFDVDSIADRYYEHLSRGEKQRVDLYVALAHGPELIILDEPCTGLDARFHESSLSLLASLCERSDKTVLVATHDARELRLASDLLWIDAGVVRQSTVAEGLARVGQYCGELAWQAQARPVNDLIAFVSELPGLAALKLLGDQRLLAFGNGAEFKVAFEKLAHSLDVPHALRLVGHEDLLHAVANGES
jgi:ABC-2 type transport system ATP-binding protein